LPSKGDWLGEMEAVVDRLIKSQYRFRLCAGLAIGAGILPIAVIAGGAGLAMAGGPHAIAAYVSLWVLVPVFVGACCITIVCGIMFGVFYWRALTALGDSVGSKVADLLVIYALPVVNVIFYVRRDRRMSEQLQRWRSEIGG